ncbi:hypothetical protein ABLB96_16795 [Acinetobacter sp. XH1741]|uniref:hypothetical protein n=1 Tax=unclassified Acinetobacter TaxID=196816 RepID=UPI0034DB6951
MFITSFGEQNITYKCCSNFLIHLYQPIQVTNAIRAAMYLVNPEKEDQRLRAKTSPQMRTFGTGQFEVKWRRDIEQNESL